MPPDRGSKPLRSRSLENVVVLQIPSRRLQAAVLALRRLPIAVLKDVVFQLGRRDRRDAKVARCVHLDPTSQSTRAVFCSQLARTSVLMSGTR